MDLEASLLTDTLVHRFICSKTLVTTELLKLILRFIGTALFKYPLI